MVVCRGRADEDGRSTGSSGSGIREQGSGARGQGPADRGSGTLDQGVGRPDDVAAMREVVGRRYRHVLEQGGPFPDLILIDGGKRPARGSLRRAGAARPREPRGHRPGQEGGAGRAPATASIRSRWPAASPALRFLQRVRDEAHRFAVTFHRRRAAMRDFCVRARRGARRRPEETGGAAGGLRQPRGRAPGQPRGPGCRGGSARGRRRARPLRRTRPARVFDSARAAMLA